MSTHIVLDEVHRGQRSNYWIAINQASCAICQMPMTGVPIVTPRPQGLIGFPTLTAAKAAQELCLTAPIPAVAKTIKEWRAGKEGAVVIDCDNPEPPQAVTIWSV
jgi:predicted dinucleotide-binding enzyme